MVAYKKVQEFKNNGKSYCQSPKKSGRVDLREVVAYDRLQLLGFDWEKFGVLDRWSLTRGGRTWKFDCSFQLLMSIPVSSSQDFSLAQYQFGKVCSTCTFLFFPGFMLFLVIYLYVFLLFFPSEPLSFCYDSNESFPKKITSIRENLLLCHICSFFIDALRIAKLSGLFIFIFIIIIIIILSLHSIYHWSSCVFSNCQVTTRTSDRKYFSQNVRCSQQSRFLGNTDVAVNVELAQVAF